MLLYREISTHAPAGGATVAYLRKHSGGGISTHAPAGGATGSSWPTATRTSKFLLTPLREGRPEKSALIFLKKILFLLTPLREGRPSPLLNFTRTCIYFYSRPCGRGDDAVHVRQLRAVISTHAPAGGATRSVLPLAIRPEFLLTPLREGRRPPARTPLLDTGFLLTPLREGRHYDAARTFIIGNFYSRPCGRGDALRSSTPRIP